MPWLTVIGAIPLGGALLLALLPSDNEEAVKRTAFGVSLVTLALALAMGASFDSSGARFQFTQSHNWISQFGARYAVGVDGIALVLILLTTVLVPVVMLASWHEVEGTRRSARAYFALILGLETLLIGVFAATDLLLFYF